jgi:hypothetical protein
MSDFSNIKFPVYRIYKNGLTWVRIDSPTQFTEIRKIGSHYERSEYDAKILPDRNHIMDLLFHFEPFAREIQSDVFDKVAILVTK